MRLSTLIPSARTGLLLTGLLAALLVLAGCGSDSSSQVRPNPDPNNGGGPGDDNLLAVYNGSVQAATDDVLAYQREVWRYLAPQERCASCHGTGGQVPLFVRGDDINQAYEAVLSLVDLGSPAQSRLVTRVAEGHNCWLSNPDACATAITGFIQSWANAAGTEIQPIEFLAPTDIAVGSSRVFPANPGDTTFSTTVYPLLTQHCASCHSESVAARQQPFLGSSNITVAYDAAKTRMRLDSPAASRLVARLADDAHSCWSVSGPTDPADCVESAELMRVAIDDFANSITETVVDPALNVSRALGLPDGLAVTAGGRLDDFIIARYEFKEGEGATAFDTRGIMDLHLNLSGDYQWMGSWGVRFNMAGGNNGKAQATTSASRRLFTQLTEAGEYSIEAWVIPDNVVQGDGGMNTTRIVSYSGSDQVRNFTLGQSMYNYDFLNRAGNEASPVRTDANGLPSLSTADADERLQATLQHVVATFDPVNGRRLYVNGEFTGDVDPLAGTGIAEWDDSFALVVGNEVTGNRPWRGAVRFLAIHNRALNAEAIAANYDVGVGARFFLLFNISHLLVDGPLTEANNPGAYIAFEVQQFDDYGYLFNQPFLIALNEEASFSGVPLQGLRIGINGSEVLIGQAYANLNTTLDTGSFVEGRQALSALGTVIELQQGADNDEFFLTFDRIGNHSYVRVVAEPPAPVAAADLATQPRVGLRNFGEINASLSVLTGVPETTQTVASTYNTVRQQLPILADMEGFLAAHQMGVTQLAVAYCSALVDNTGLRNSFFTGGFGFAQPLQTAFANDTERNKIIEPLVQRLLAGDIDGTRLPSMPDEGEIEGELNALIDRMMECDSCNNAARTVITVKAVCAAAMGSAVMLLH